MKHGETRLRVLLGEEAGSLPSTAFRRRLVAVMFTDITGFSSLMARDEERTMRLVQEHRKIVRACIVEHEGVEHETIGDAFVVLFDSAVQALRCACAIHRSLAARNAGRPRHEQIWVRIGIHLGDVLFSADNEIYGDAVNLAARVQPLAEPGGTCITAAVWNQCKGKLDVQARSIGIRPLKNIPDPPELFRIVSGAGLAPRAPLARPTRRRVARLALLAAASGIAAGGVIAYFASPASPRDRSSERAVVAAGGRAGSGEADVAATPAFSPDASADASPDGARVPDPTKVEPQFSAVPAAQKRFRIAYEAYLTGHFRTAETEFQAGLAVDPVAPLAHLLLADIYQMDGREDEANREIGLALEQTNASTANVDVRTFTAEQEILLYLLGGVGPERSAEDLDWIFGDFTSGYPNLMLGYVVWGEVLLQRGRCDLAEKALDRAIARDPSVVVAFLTKARCALLTGHPERALEITETAAKWHPASAPVHELAAQTLFLLGRRDEAFDRLRRALEIDPSHHSARISLAVGLLLADREAEAAAAVERLLQPETAVSVRVAAVRSYASALAGKGRLREALALAADGRRQAVAAGELLPAWRLGSAALPWAAFSGKWEEADRIRQELRDLVADLDFPEYAKSYRLADLLVFDGILAAERGDLDGARRVLDRLEHMDPSVLLLASLAAVRHPVEWRVRTAEQRWDEALALLEIPPAGPPADLPHCERRRNRARVLLAAGRDDEAAVVLDGLLDHAAFCSAFLDQGLTVAEGLVWRAELAARHGDPDLARRLLDRFHAFWPRPDGDLDPVVRARRLSSRLAVVGLRPPPDPPTTSQ